MINTKYRDKEYHHNYRQYYTRYCCYFHVVSPFVVGGFVLPCHAVPCRALPHRTLPDPTPPDQPCHTLPDRAAPRATVPRHIGLATPYLTLPYLTMPHQTGPDPTPPHQPRLFINGILIFHISNKLDLLLFLGRHNCLDFINRLENRL